METTIIKDLSNEEYHRGEKYRDYISSSQLRKYLVSPAEYKRSLEEPNETTPAMKLGTMCHDALEFIHNTGDFSLSAWHDSFAVFDAPINPTSGAPYGATTKKYQEAYQEFLASVGDKQIASKEELDIAHAIARSIERDPTMSRVILKGEPEVSHFLNYDGVGFKTRPDLETNKIIFDYKSISDKLTKDKLMRRIVDSGYDISAAFYQWMCHEQTGEWKSFYIVWLQTIPPYDICICSLNGLAYTVVDGMMLNDQTHGARQFEILRDMHIRCSQEDRWPGADIYVRPDEKGRRIMEFDVPAWITNSVVEPYFL